jgi:hypothetical protein
MQQELYESRVNAAAAAAADGPGVLVRTNSSGASASPSVMSASQPARARALAKGRELVGASGGRLLGGIGRIRRTLQQQLPAGPPPQ